MYGEEQFQEYLNDLSREHLAFAALGFRNAEIGKIIYASVSTVKKTFKQIFEMFNVKDRTGAVNEAWRLGVIDSGYIDKIIEKYNINTAEYDVY